MSRRIIHAIALTAASFLYCAQPALAAPMLCSGEQKTCLALCVKFTNPAYAANCVANCRASLAYCKHTGCWDNGTSRYCGLSRQ